MDDKGARGQLAGMAVMLTATRGYLPDDALCELVQRMGGPRAYFEGVVSIGFLQPDMPQQEQLLEGAQDVLRRLRHFAARKQRS